MAIAEGRTIPFTGPEAVDVGVLETFEYAGPEQEIVTETREFSPVCPYSGLPDFATLRIAYVPGDRCIELKSLKYYVTSYRNVGIFQEHATAKIAEDLFGVLQPRRLSVTTMYNTRGGFDTTCRDCRRRRLPQPAEGSVPAPRALAPAGLTISAARLVGTAPARASARGAAGSAGWPAPRRHGHDRRGLAQILGHGLVVGVALRVVGVEVPPRILVEVEARHPVRNEREMVGAGLHGRAHAVGAERGHRRQQRLPQVGQLVPPLQRLAHDPPRAVVQHQDRLNAVRLRRVRGGVGPASPAVPPPPR